MIDWDRVRALREEIGQDGFEEVVEMFLDEVDAAVARLEAVGSSAALEEDLHFLKGCALNLGFEQLALLCQQAERSAGAAAAVDVGAVIGSYRAARAAFLAGLTHAVPARAAG
ncbi:MAG: Hpt domain-containing protein [Gemmobacter sp.]